MLPPATYAYHFTSVRVSAKPYIAMPLPSTYTLSQRLFKNRHRRKARYHRACTSPKTHQRPLLPQNARFAAFCPACHAKPYTLKAPFAIYGTLLARREHYVATRLLFILVKF
ncbi:hypothetical protein NPIL_114271 [Nephila pilipes]|uniref:Uncharacterized protein n=1 Tax=Nephila pilipes TaxID=299642 RepID=A0A8X6NRX0_NEPPI|nr:hypothetical protein NPIL_114271 [Nephila pilipes]